MRAYIIDEISRSDMEKINSFLKETAIAANLDQIFWVPIPDDLLSDIQFKHSNCRPHVFAVELGSDWVKLEFFVRSLKTLQCTCPAYCSAQQRDYVIEFTHNMIENLGVRT